MTRPPRSVGQTSNARSLDLCARLVVMASYFYYRFDCNMMSDSEFDSICVRLSENFDRLTPLRRFMLGDALSIRSSGYGVYVTVHAQDACLHYAQEHRLPMNRDVEPISRWRFSERHQLRYASLMAK